MKKGFFRQGILTPLTTKMQRKREAHYQREEKKGFREKKPHAYFALFAGGKTEEEEELSEFGIEG